MDILQNILTKPMVVFLFYHVNYLNQRLTHEYNSLKLLKLHVKHTKRRNQIITPSKNFIIDYPTKKKKKRNNKNHPSQSSNWVFVIIIASFPPVIHLSPNISLPSPCSELLGFQIKGGKIWRDLMAFEMARSV